MRVISKIFNRGIPLKLLSRQADSAFEMMQNDGTLVSAAARFEVFTNSRLGDETME